MNTNVGFPIVVVTSDFIEDWHTIERAEHDGREWFEETSYGARFMSSARLGNACIEGTTAEMRAIAHAIRTRTSVSFKRVAVRVKAHTAYFQSPKNSEGDTPIALIYADELAAQITRELPG